MTRAAPRAPASRVPGPAELLRGVAAAGLAVDAYVHADLATTYDANSAMIGQGTLFRLEAVLAALAALLVLVFRGRLLRTYAFLVAAGRLALVLVYRYVDPGALGPFPDMFGRPSGGDRGDRRPSRAQSTPLTRRPAAFPAFLAPNCQKTPRRSAPAWSVPSRLPPL